MSREPQSWQPKGPLPPVERVTDQGHEYPTHPQRDGEHFRRLYRETHERHVVEKNEP